jgi:hypothetical protein
MNIRPARSAAGIDSGLAASRRRASSKSQDASPAPSIFGGGDFKAAGGLPKGKTIIGSHPQGVQGTRSTRSIASMVG